MSGDHYQPMLDLADRCDAAGAELRERARLGEETLDDLEQVLADVAGSGHPTAETASAAEAARAAVRTATAQALTSAVDLDADATVVRATVLTYRWIDDLQETARQTLGDLAARSMGSLAPDLDLGSTVVSAGLIEIDPGDREQVARYLSDLAVDHPELMEHFSGGGLLESLRMRSMLTLRAPSGALADDVGVAGRAALGITPFRAEASSALRDAMGTLRDESLDVIPATRWTAPPLPRGLADLLERLEAVTTGVLVEQVASGRWIAYLGAAPANPAGTIRLVSVDRARPARLVVRAIEEALRGSDAEGPAHVLLVARGPAGGTAAEIASQPPESFQVDAVVTLSSPSSQVPDIPPTTRLVCLESRADPVTALGSLVNAEADNRLMVVFDPDDQVPPHVAGGRAVDASDHPRVLEEVRRLQAQGYLAPPAP